METSKRKRFSSIEADEAIEQLEEQLSDELDETDLDDIQEEDVTTEEIPIQEEDDDVTALMAEADEMLAACEQAELPDEQPIVSEEQEVLAACEALQAQLEACDGVQAEEEAPVAPVKEEQACTAAEEVKEEAPVAPAKEEQACTVAAEEKCPECGEKDCKCASEQKPGVEDEIGDEANGGDPSVSDITDSKVDCDEYADVFPTNSEYVAKITKRLDRVADALEKRNMKKMAFRVDQLSDRLEASIRKH